MVTQARVLSPQTGSDGRLKLLRRLLLLLNFVVMAVSFYLIVDGAYDLNYFQSALESWKKHLEEAVPWELSNSITGTARPINAVVITLGVMTFCGSMLGCIVSGNKTRIVVDIFLAYLVVAVVVNLILGMTGLIYEHLNVSPELNDISDKILEDLKKPNTTNWYAFWKGLQTEFSCCGVKGYKDWFNASLIKTPNGVTFPPDVPPSCCNLRIKAARGIKLPEKEDEALSDSLAECIKGMASKSEAEAGQHIYTEGCVVMLHDGITVQMRLGGGLLIGISVINMVALFVACKLKSHWTGARFGFPDNRFRR